MNGSGDEQQIAANFEALGGEVTLADLFEPEWMQVHTNAATIDEFFADSDFDIRTQADFEAISDDQWDDYVAATTDFSDWRAMLAQALTDFDNAEEDSI